MPVMITAPLRTLSALSAPALQRVIAQSLGLAAAVFALLWLAVELLLVRLHLFAWWPLDWLADALGGLAVLGLSWLLFPAVSTLIMSFFLERVATEVEALDYPGNGPPRRRRRPSPRR